MRELDGQGFCSPHDTSGTTRKKIENCCALPPRRCMRADRPHGSITLSTLLTGGYLERAEIMAGEGGLSREVRDVTVVSTPDSGPWLDGNELLLTTGYPFMNEPESLLRSVGVFIEKDASALAFKEGRYMPAFSAEMLGLCERAHLPLIRLPKETKWVDIIRPVYGLLASREEEASQFPGTEEETQSQDPYSVQANPSQGSVTYGDHQHYAVIVIRVPTLDLMVCVTRCLQSSLYTLGLGIKLVPKGQYVAVLWPMSQEGFHFLEHARYAADVLIGNELRVALPVATSSGPVIASGIAEAFEQARAALDAHSFLHCKKDVIQYDASEFFDMLMLLKREYLTEFSDRKLKKAEDYDNQHQSHLIETLEAYFQQNCSVKRTSEVLYVHPKTVQYRLNHISNLMNLSRSDFRSLVEIYVALQVRRSPARYGEKIPMGGRGVLDTQ